jgi:hypothetical protein
MDIWSLSSWSSNFLFFNSANRRNNSSTCTCMFIIVSWHVNFVIFLCMSCITSSWTYFFQRKTSYFLPIWACLILWPSFLIMVIQQYKIINYQKSLGYDTNWLGHKQHKKDNKNNQHKILSNIVTSQTLIQDFITGYFFLSILPL